MKESHGKIISNLIHVYPDYINKRIKVNGIIHVGGDKYSWSAFFSLRRLRETGSVTPVEIYIPTEKEYDAKLCDIIFPSLGAKCIVMSSFIITPNFLVGGFGLKALALMLTTFENVLLLDSDNIPIKNPDFLFKSKVYKDKGFVDWPDYWRRSTSPIFYDLANVHVTENKQIRYSYSDDRDHP